MSRSSRTRERSKQLLERDSFKSWIEVPKEKDFEGIYVIIEDDKVIYVGRAEDIRSRLKQHMTGRNATQEIDVYIRSQRLKRLQRHFFVNWIKDKGQRCNEFCYILNITKYQGTAPKFYKRHGDSCGACISKLGSFSPESEEESDESDP